MATTLVSIGEYLAGHYEPDAEYVDGVIEERPMGELDHNRLQKHLLFLLSGRAVEPYFESIQEQRVQVSLTRYRIPDICLIRADTPEEQISTTPPLLCIEVLSPTDTLSKTMVRIRDFFAMGVPEVWILDPARRTVYICTHAATQMQTAGALSIAGTGISLSIKEVFAVLDKSRRP